MNAAEILLTLMDVNAVGVLAYLRWQRERDRHNGEPCAEVPAFKIS